MQVKKLLVILDQLAPPNLAEDWDSDGLQIGDLFQKISEIHIALEAETTLVSKLPANSALIVHHPPLFNFKSPINFLTNEGQLIKLCARKGISIIAVHTRFDKVKGGLADEAAKIFDLDPVRPLISHRLVAYKLVTFVPEEHVNAVAEALFESGAGVIGKYKKCSFGAKGVGTFLGLEGSKPTIGRAGKFEKADEIRLEVLVRGSPQPAVDALLKAHPYEEPAYDIYPVVLESKDMGLGRIGELKKRTLVDELTEIITKKLKPQSLRIVGDNKRRIKKIAILPGSGERYIEAASANAELFVTSDIKYHSAKDALERGLTIIEVDHGSIEKLFVPALAKMLGNLKKRVKIIAHEEIRALWRTKGGIGG